MSTEYEWILQLVNGNKCPEIITYFLAIKRIRFCGDFTIFTLFYYVQNLMQKDDEWKTKYMMKNEIWSMESFCKESEREWDKVSERWRMWKSQLLNDIKWLPFIWNIMNYQLHCVYASTNITFLTFDFLRIEYYMESDVEIIEWSPHKWNIIYVQNSPILTFFCLPTRMNAYLIAEGESMRCWMHPRPMFTSLVRTLFKISNVCLELPFQIHFLFIREWFRFAGEEKGMKVEKKNNNNKKQIKNEKVNVFIFYRI